MTSGLRASAMRRIFVEKIAPLLPFPVECVETFESVERYSRMNFVFRVRVRSCGRRAVLYLKQARKYLAASVRSPSDFLRVAVDPRRMSGEVRLMNFLRDVWGSAVVPTVYFFDERDGTMVMSDVRKGGKLLVEEFNRGRVHPWLGTTMGGLMGKLHGSTYRIRENWCGSRSWRRSLRWYIEKRMTMGIRTFVPSQVVRTFLEDVEHVPHSIVWGDPVVRNIIVRKNRTMSCVDFDYVHTYDPAHDIGILTAHWWWMTLHARSKVRADARTFLRDFWLNYQRTLKQYHVSARDCTRIIKRAHQWAGVYLVSCPDGERGSYFKQWPPQWKGAIRKLGIDLFLGKNP